MIYWGQSIPVMRQRSVWWSLLVWLVLCSPTHRGILKHKVLSRLKVILCVQEPFTVKLIPTLEKVTNKKILLSRGQQSACFVWACFVTLFMVITHAYWGLLSTICWLEWILCMHTDGWSVPDMTPVWPLNWPISEQYEL